MPIVTVKMIEGRTDEQKRALVKEMTEVIERNTNAPKENITIIIEEMAKNHYAKAGVLAIDQA